VILGSTGSIGRQAIEVVRAHPDEFKIIALAARGNIDAMLAQLEEVKPDLACLVEPDAALALMRRSPSSVKVLSGTNGLAELCALDDADIILNAVVGSDGLAATLAALDAGKRVALANKESLVAAGELVNKKLMSSKGIIVPVDSEHNALWQCLAGEKMSEVEQLTLTASGGPFRGWTRAELEAVTPAQALDHPRWKMGPRVTIDSATLMNKGFEVIEAYHLFRLGLDKIKVMIHPQSIVHAMVEFIDGSIKAHLGPTDMRLPILHSFSWPDRLTGHIDRLDLAAIGALEFYDAPIGESHCLRMAYDAARRGQSYPTALNASDEVAVAAFLDGRIGFLEIGNIIDTVLERHKPFAIDSFAAFVEADTWAKREAELVIGS